MPSFDGISDVNMILSISSQELLDSHKELMESAQIISGGESSQKRHEEQELVNKLLNSLENASLALSKEIDSGRVVKIDPSVYAQMQRALEVAMKAPNLVDVKVNEIYLSIFGWNTTLWHALNRMQKLLKTIDLNNQRTGIKVAKVEKPAKERRKRRGQK